MATKRQQTMAKITRERMVRERRERKQEKKRAAAAERKAQAAETMPTTLDDTGSEPDSALPLVGDDSV